MSTHCQGVYLALEIGELSVYYAELSTWCSVASMTNFYSYVEPLSKYSPVTLHLSPATRILNENLDCTIFLIILTAGRIGKNGRRGRNVNRKKAYGQSLTGHDKADHMGYNQSTLIEESQGGENRQE